MQKTFFIRVLPHNRLQDNTAQQTTKHTSHSTKKSQKPNTTNNKKKKPKSNLLKWTQDVKQTTEALTFKRSERTKKNI